MSTEKEEDCGCALPVGIVENAPSLMEKYPWLPLVAIVAVISLPLGFAALVGGKKGR